jgi:hypothetical protein
MKRTSQSNHLASDIPADAGKQQILSHFPFFTQLSDVFQIRLLAAEEQTIRHL